MSNWYELVDSSDYSLLQGDILFNVSVYFLDPDVTFTEDTKLEELELYIEERDVIVMTQSCDIQKALNPVDRKGNPLPPELNTQILLCPIGDLSQFKLDKAKSIRDNKVNTVYLINKFDDGSIYDYLVVDLSSYYTLPLGHIINFLKTSGSKRPRLYNPYREELSQKFALTFMRVGTDDSTKIKDDELDEGIKRAVAKAREELAQRQEEEPQGA
ncbi:hypothetical protein HZF08_33770 [Paenibacillus sp. CGMCC 1.16610]|uniref:Uncharacterized protein n=1 Tax=Paenibacillus anseongense TaxID=2682845 RepID=A0ABW9U3E3_9BACL|nr:MULTISPECIES: hypothetical protein [Paenibacillus]MBA2943242.1 hypothetical protein [Paenibacillus sp. CGMCC 1.16610]MVQ33740.1 hypothetical protein [Paenibacillus anseongense]